MLWLDEVLCNNDVILKRAKGPPVLSAVLSQRDLPVASPWRGMLAEALAQISLKAWAALPLHCQLHHVVREQQQKKSLNLLKTSTKPFIKTKQTGSQISEKAAPGP